MTRTLHVLIDDCRDGSYDVICRNYDAAARVIPAIHGFIEHIYLDHDLGEGKDGYAVCNLLCENGWMPPQVHLVTGNPVGRDNMGACLLKHGYKHKIAGNPYEFIKKENLSSLEAPEPDEYGFSAYDNDESWEGFEDKKLRSHRSKEE